MRTILTSLFFISLSLCLSAQCPLNITLSTQDAIDNFATNFPNCTELPASIRIRGADIEDLNGLSVLTHVEGSLEIIDCPGLIDFSGLNQISAINNNLIILGNIHLETLSGLENITHVGGRLSLEQNPSLPNLNGLNAVESVGEALFIYNNTGLTSLTGLENLQSIGGNLVITINNNLTSCNIQSVCSYLNEPPAFVEVSFNETGCETPEEVLATCETAPLSTVFLSFSAESASQNIVLNGSLSAQETIPSFNIEHSTGGDFHKIGHISASDIQLDDDAFQFVHQDPHIGLNLYRLAMLAQNGDIRYSNLSSVIFQKKDLAVFPNPARDKISLTGLVDKQTPIRIFDHLGQLKRTIFADKGNMEIEVIDLSKGMYFIEIGKVNNVEIVKVVLN